MLSKINVFACFPKRVDRVNFAFTTIFPFHKQTTESPNNSSDFSLVFTVIEKILLLLYFRHFCGFLMALFTFVYIFIYFRQSISTATTSIVYISVGSPDSFGKCMKNGSSINKTGRLGGMKIQISMP